MPVFKELYKRVVSGEETRRVLTSCSGAKYQDQLKKELSTMANSEMWRAARLPATSDPRSRQKNIRSNQGAGWEKNLLI